MRLFIIREIRVIRCLETSSVTFNGEVNDVTVSEFVITNGKRFSGTVLYDGTSIPVKASPFGFPKS